MTSRNLAPPGDWLGEPWQENARPGVGFLVVVTILAAALRLYHLAGASLWVDEILTWNMLAPGRGLGFLEQFFDSIQGPLYLAIVWPLVRLQENEWMMRLPAALAGIAAVPAFGVLLGRIVDERSARLGTLLLAISPFHVWYSQEARGYSFLILLVILLTLAYLDMAEKGPSPGRAFLVALCGALAVMSNMSALFFITGLGLGVLVFHRPARASGWILWAVALGGAVLLSAPWILKASGIWAVDRILPGATMGQALRGETTFAPLAVPYSFYTFFAGHSFGPSLRELHQPDRMGVLVANLPFLALAAVPVGLGLLSSLRHLGSRRLFVILLIGVPLVIMVLLAVRNIKPWNPRYVAVVFPLLLALLALGLARMRGRLGQGMIVLMIVVSVISLGNHYWNGRYAKADVRGAEAFIQASDHSRLPVLVPAVGGVYGFYAGPEVSLINPYDRPPLQDEADGVTFFDSALAQHDEFWFVSAREWYFDPKGVLPVVLARAGHLRLDREFSGVKIYHWSALADRERHDER